MQLFFSHSTRDRVIAQALKQLLHGVFGETHLKIEYSSEQKSGGGIPPGALWLPWITDRIKQADRVYVLLTRGSMGRPWVIWESGAAAGVALGMNRDSPVVPVTFGVTDSDIPHPFHASQRVRGDADGEDGIDRLIQDLNLALGRPLPEAVLQTAATERKPAYFARIKEASKLTSSRGSLVSSVSHSFAAGDLNGSWVTAYEFESSQGRGRHVDIAHLRAESDRRVVSRNYPPEPITERRTRRPFRNEIEAELANRHLVGFWKNISDNRYFGSIHLAVLPGETVMEGHYTHLISDVEAGSEQWKWVRLDPDSLVDVDLSRVWLRDLDTLHALVSDHSKHDDPLPLAAVAEGI